jgi:hypothetical protein
MYILSHVKAMMLTMCITGGEQTDSQLFAFAGGAGPVSLEPMNEAGTCLAVNGNVLDQAACSGRGDATQTFTFG